MRGTQVIPPGRQRLAHFAPPASRAGVYRNVGVFALSFVAAMALVRPEPPAPASISAKLESLERLRAVDLVFVGSSRTHFNLTPASFDAEAGRLGLSVQSFNLGVPGAGGHEVDYIVENYLLDLPQLKAVFIEFPTFEYQTIDPDERTFRKIYWHDARRTIDAVRSSLAGPMPLGLRWLEAEEHLWHFVLRFCGLWPSGGEVPPDFGPDGFQPWDHPSRKPIAGPPKPAFLKNTDYVVSREIIRRQQAVLRRRGIRVFYVIPPGTPDLSPLLEMARAGEIRLFKFNDPREYPELYQPDTNGGYLLSKGARLYSTMLAEKLAEASRTSHLTIADGADSRGRR